MRRSGRSMIVAIGAVALGVGVAVVWQLGETAPAPDTLAVIEEPAPSAALATATTTALERRSAAPSRTLRLIDAEDARPLARHAVRASWLPKSREHTDRDGVWPLPDGDVPEDACFVADGYYPARMPPVLGADVPVRPRVRVVGRVVAGAALDGTSLCVAWRCRPLHAALGDDTGVSRVRGDRSFAFAPQHWTEHELDLCWAQDGGLSVPIA